MALPQTKRGYGDVYPKEFKLVIVGDSGVGKSGFVLRLAKDEFHPDARVTIGVDFANCSSSIDGETIRAQIWDTAGQEKLRCLPQSYYQGASGIILFFDLCDKSSFDSLDGWRSEISRFVDPDVPVLLVGNKNDDITNRRISTSIAQSYAAKNGLGYIETSGKTSSNVTLAFVTILEKVYKREVEYRADNPDDEWEIVKSVRLEDFQDIPTPKSRSCC
ncbi:hypothetical protein RvY_06592-2 [Ramazzottius varieornatus]|uniref:Uncharacterized protein n=1 Tax=Ramazzottius varieornatus TaxID=947166 RepID=A0A1D1UZJ4_RAMVA|nr:hypothetical protein RvY_06592-2 [Ramazzottius varieornatus]